MEKRIENLGKLEVNINFTDYKKTHSALEQHTPRNHSRSCISEYKLHSHSFHSLGCTSMYLVRYNFLCRKGGRTLAHTVYRFYPTQNLAYKHTYFLGIHRYHSLQRKCIFHARKLIFIIRKQNSVYPTRKYHRRKFNNKNTHTPIGQVGTQNPAKFFKWSG